MKKKAKKINQAKDKKNGSNYVAVLLEEMRDKIDIIGEGQTTMREEMNRRFDEVNERLKGHDEKFDIIAGRLSKHDEDFKIIKSQLDRHDENFKAILEHQFNTDDRLEKIEMELKEIKMEIKEAEKSGISREGFNLLASRMEKMEKEMEKYKTMFRQTAKTRN